MSVFDEQPPLINHKELCQWLKNNYSFFKIKDVKLRSLNSVTYLSENFGYD